MKWVIQIFSIFCLEVCLLNGAHGQSVRADVVYSFHGQNGNGGGPSGLAADSSGNLYGTTKYGGTSNRGAVFRLTPSTTAGLASTESELFSFSEKDKDGNPESGVAIDANGTLYGTTSTGSGAVFTLSPPTAPGGVWKKTILHRFQASSTIGSGPVGGLVFGFDGALYGATSGGGMWRKGTVFKLARSSKPNAEWIYTELHSFGGTTGDGDSPAAGVILDSQGSIYGSTYNGGNSSCTSEPNRPVTKGCGTVFRLTPPSDGDGVWQETILHNFQTGDEDGSFPAAELVLDRSGVLYGSTESGGVHAKDCGQAGCGVVFSLSPPASGVGDWTEEILHRFSDYPDGQHFVGESPRLMLNLKGQLLGATPAGGVVVAGCRPRGCGIVFKLFPTNTSPGEWTESIVYNFTGRDGDGSAPSHGALLLYEGKIWGTTLEGGISNLGTIYRLTD